MSLGRPLTLFTSQSNDRHQITFFSRAFTILPNRLLILMKQAYTAAEKAALILPRVASLISLLACIGTACETWVDHRHQRGSVVSRTQLVLQLPLLCYCAAYAVGSIAAPSGVWGAHGTVTTCEVQGFMIQFAVTAYVPLDMLISTVFILIIRYNWNEKQLRGLEKWFHILVWPLVMACTVIPLMMDMYNSSWETCWLDVAPTGCDEDENIECERGEYAWVFHILAYVLSLSSLFYSIYAMLFIYLFVKRVEDRSRQYDFSSSEEGEPAARARSRAVGIQGILYAGVTALGGLPLVFSAIFTLVMGHQSLFLNTFGNIMFTLIGLFNMLVNFRSRTTQHTSYGRFLHSVYSKANEDTQLKSSATSRTMKSEQVKDVNQFSTNDVPQDS